MIALKQDISKGELIQLINEEYRLSKINLKHEPAINLVLLTDQEKYQTEQSIKSWSFSRDNILQCKELELKVYQFLENKGIEYAIPYEGDYYYYFRFFIEENGYSFDSLFNKMKELTINYEEVFFTFQILFTLLQDEILMKETKV